MRKALIFAAILAMSAAAHAGRKDGAIVHWLLTLLGVA